MCVYCVQLNYFMWNGLSAVSKLCPMCPNRQLLMVKLSAVSRVNSVLSVHYFGPAFLQIMRSNSQYIQEVETNLHLLTKQTYTEHNCFISMGKCATAVFILEECASWKHTNACEEKMHTFINKCLRNFFRIILTSIPPQWKFW